MRVIKTILAAAAFFAALTPPVAAEYRINDQYALPPHPFRGVVEVCGASATVAPSCVLAQTPHVYDTMAECERDTERRVMQLARLLSREHPDFDFQLTYSCVEQRDMANA